MTGLAILRQLWNGSPDGAYPRTRGTFIAAAALGVCASVWMFWPFAPLTARDVPSAARANAPPAGAGMAGLALSPAALRGPGGLPSPSTAEAPGVPVDPFVGADDSGVQGQLRVLDDQLAVKKKEVELAKLTGELASLRNGSGAKSSPSKMPGVPTEPPRYAAMPPPNFEAGPPAFSRPPGAAAPPAPTNAREDAGPPEWPTVKMVANGEAALAVIEIDGRLQHVAEGDTAGGFDVEKITERGIRFRHVGTRAVSTIGLAQSGHSGATERTTSAGPPASTPGRGPR